LHFNDTLGSQPTDPHRLPVVGQCCHTASTISQQHHLMESWANPLPTPTCWHEVLHQYRTADTCNRHNSKLQHVLVEQTHRSAMCRCAPGGRGANRASRAPARVSGHLPACTLQKPSSLGTILPARHHIAGAHAQPPALLVRLLVPLLLTAADGRDPATVFVASCKTHYSSTTADLRLEMLCGIVWGCPPCPPKIKTQGLNVGRPLHTYLPWPSY
jgi:hypothetical protein